MAINLNNSRPITGNHLYDDFITNYGIKNIQVNRDYDRIDYGYNKSAHTYSNREETIDIEIPRSGFEELVRLNGKYDDIYSKSSEEAYLRSQYPAIKEAYDKYRMLLELYK